ncbi:MAG TPA: hypothetical protein VK031_06310 [Tissierellaceae bacterium]|nr:hypothetical protein [Tissierellaceae bacterium]
MVVAKSQLDYYPEEVQEKRRVEEERRKRKQKAIQRQRRLNVFLKVATLMVVGIILSISLYILKGYANISQISMEINELEKQKKELEEIKASLDYDLIEIKSSLKISEDAMYKLGMTYPRQDQIVYVSIDEGTEDNIGSENNQGISKKINEVVSLFSSFF